ncbi:MAG: thioredoxin family protein [Candidatus Obscuribacterales bacterium]|nr:thioredoxin family protein [Candidatus Obscuribacterales bacterium]
MNSYQKFASLCMLFAGLTNCYPSFGGDAKFDIAAKQYLDGQFDQSLAAFQSLSKTDPNNAKIRYYIGLNEMRLKDRDKAGNEFDWIYDHTSDPALKAVAQTWLNRLERHRLFISDNYSIGRPVVDPHHAPVTSVKWFYTNWCPKCKRFKPVFEQTAPRFKSVNFEKFNSEDPANWTQVAKYHVKSYPTLVYFDKDGKIIENYAAAPLGATFAIHLQELGAKQSAN